MCSKSVRRIFHSGSASTSIFVTEPWLQLNITEQRYLFTQRRTCKHCLRGNKCKIRWQCFRQNRYYICEGMKPGKAHLCLDAFQNSHERQETLTRPGESKTLTFPNVHIVPSCASVVRGDPGACNKIKEYGQCHWGHDHWHVRDALELRFKELGKLNDWRNSDRKNLKRKWECEMSLEEAYEEGQLDESL